MHRPTDWLLVGLLILVHLSRSQGAVTANQNADHFKVLCSVYNAIGSPLKNLYDPSEVEEVGKAIDVINASLSDETWFNEVKAAADPAKVSEDFRNKNGGIQDSWKRWSAAVNGVNQKGGFTKLSSTSLAAKLAQVKLKKIEGQAERIINEIENHNKSAQIDEINKQFEDAVGKPGIDRGSAETRAALCGPDAMSTKGGAAGDNLVVDFLCLCARDGGHSGSNGAKGTECSPDAPGERVAEWSANSNNQVQKDAESATWEAIKAACAVKELDGRVQPSPARVKEALERFWTEVRVGGKASSANVPGLFGKATGAKGSLSNGCKGVDGGSNDAVCVFYGPSTAWTALQWPSRVKKGIELLEHVETNATAIRAKIEHLKILRHRAEEIYEEARAASENEKTDSAHPTQNQNQKQNPGGTTDRTTVQEPNAMSTAGLPRFILPWTIFI